MVAVSASTLMVHAPSLIQQPPLPWGGLLLMWRFPMYTIRILDQSKQFVASKTTRSTKAGVASLLTDEATSRRGMPWSCVVERIDEERVLHLLSISFDAQGKRTVGEHTAY